MMVRNACRKTWLLFWIEGTTGKGTLQPERAELRRDRTRNQMRRGALMYRCRGEMVSEFPWFSGFYEYKCK